jgi:hypothetical protein
MPRPGRLDPRHEMLVEAEHVGRFGHVTHNIIGDGCHARPGPIARHWQPARVGGEIYAIRHHGQTLVIESRRRSLQSILPSSHHRLGIKRSHEEFDARRGQIDADPVHQAASLFVGLEPFAAVGDTLKYFCRRNGTPTVPQINSNRRDDEDGGNKHYEFAACDRTKSRHLAVLSSTGQRRRRRQQSHFK